MLSYERQWNEYPRDATYDARGEMPFNVLVEEDSLVEQIHAFNAFLDTAAVLHPQLQEIDFRRETPVFEASGHRPLFQEPDRFHDVMTRVVVDETYLGA